MMAIVEMFQLKKTDMQKKKELHLSHDHCTQTTTA